MTQKHVLFYEEKPVGVVELTKSGRFYSLHCRFHSKKNEVYRLLVANKKEQVDLGVCIQYADGAGLDRCLPINHVGEEPLRFYLRGEEGFVPISATQPFLHLSKLADSYFAVRSGVKGIVIR